MKRRSNTRVFSALAAIASFVGVMCMFANIFSEEVNSAEGSVFVAIFGLKSGRHPVIPLIIGFVGLLLAIIVGFIGFIMADKAKTFVPLLEIAIGLAVGILFFFVISLYTTANGNSDFATHTGSVRLGAGSICVIVFSFLTAAIGALNFVLDRKN